MTLDLPYPPSVNRYWRHPSRGPLAGRHLISAEGRAYREQVALLCRQRLVQPLDGWVAVEATFTPPDRRGRDVDNLSKALLDALQHAGVMRDDSQVRRLTLEMLEAAPKQGRAVVTVRPWAPGARPCVCGAAPASRGG